MSARGASPGQNGSPAATSVISLALSAARRAPSAVKVFVSATATRPRDTTRTRRLVSSLAVLWVMEELANRVRPPHSCTSSTSTPSDTGQAERGIGDRAEAVGADRSGHQPRTPTWTSRNRAGEAPWPTRATWPGWPFPQLGVPHTTQSSRPAIASHDPQNSGVIPV